MRGALAVGIKGEFPLCKRTRASRQHPPDPPPHTRTRWETPVGRAPQDQPLLQAAAAAAPRTPLRAGLRGSRPLLNNFCLRAAAVCPRLRLDRLPGSEALGEGARLATLQPLSPRPPPGRPARPPYPAQLGAAARRVPEAQDRHPPALRLPLGVGGAGWGRGRRAAGRAPSPRRSRLPPPPPSPRPSARSWGALRPPGGPLAAVPETRAGGGGGPRRQHRPPRPSGRSLLTSANFLVPLGGSERTRARAPGRPRPRWASRLVLGAPGHPPGAAGARWRGASLPPGTQLQVNAGAPSACHRSRSPWAFISRADPGCVTSSVWLEHTIPPRSSGLLKGAARKYCATRGPRHGPGRGVPAGPRPGGPQQAAAGASLRRGVAGSPSPPGAERSLSRRGSGAGRQLPFPEPRGLTGCQRPWA